MVYLPLLISPTGKTRYKVEDCGYFTSCRVWQMAENGNGYGIIGVGTNEMDYAHRNIYEKLVDDIPYEFLVHHKCENTLCVNLKHLEAKTSEDHAQYHEFGSEKCKPGCECNHHKRHWEKRIGSDSRSKLDENKVRKIRLLCANGKDRGIVAKEFGIARNTVCDVVNRKAWKHVE
jgi:hypothetical protein